MVNQRRARAALLGWPLRFGTGLVVGLVVGSMVEPAHAQIQPDSMPTGRSAPVPAPPAIPAGGAYPIDLATALRLAEAENPTIAEARTAILEALALQQVARSLLVPTLNAGTNYHDHTGNLQRSSGKIFRLQAEQSLYFGGGARTLAAESVAIPMFNIVSPLAEAVYEPLVARQRLAAARFATRATSNDVLLEVALLHLDLIGARLVWGAQRLSESQSAVIVRMTTDFAEAGRGRDADAHRAEVDWRLRRLDVQRAEEEWAVASARLAQRLNLDPAIQLLPWAAGPLAPITLVDLASDQESLIQSGLRLRPELGARGAAIGLAEARVQEERSRPLLPFLWLGFSSGAFGGGSEKVPNEFGHFTGRTDFDVRCYWTLANFGIGNMAQIRRRRAEAGQAVAEQSKMINQVRHEVSSALAEGRALRTQVDLAIRRLTTAEPGFEADLARSRGGLGRPIEVLDSLSLLAEARVKLIRSIVRFNQSQFRLFVALGSPPPGPSGLEPAQRPPITTPLRAPIVRPM
jgi:outer membrane protein TolC